MFVPLEVDSSLALKTELHHKRKDAEAAAEAAADAAAGEGGLCLLLFYYCIRESGMCLALDVLKVKVC